MPLTAKGREIRAAMDKHYGADKGDRVFYASINSGKITGADKGHRKKRKTHRKAKR